MFVTLSFGLVTSSSFILVEMTGATTSSSILAPSSDALCSVAFGSQGKTRVFRLCAPPRFPRHAQPSVTGTPEPLASEGNKNISNIVLSCVIIVESIHYFVLSSWIFKKERGHRSPKKESRLEHSPAARGVANQKGFSKVASSVRGQTALDDDCGGQMLKVTCVLPVREFDI